MKGRFRPSLLRRLPSRQARKFRQNRSCDCRCLRVEGDLVRNLEQVLPDRRQHQLGVGLVHLKIPGAVQAEQQLHGAEAPFDPIMSLRDHLVEALLGSPQRAISGSLPHDPVLVATAQGSAVRLALLRLVRQDPLHLRALDHGIQLRAFGTVGQRCADLFDVTFLVATGKALESERGLRPLLHPTRIWIGTEMLYRIVRRIVLGPILRGHDMLAGPGRAFDRRLGPLHLETMLFDLPADLGQKVIMHAAPH